MICIRVAVWMLESHWWMLVASKILKECDHLMLGIHKAHCYQHHLAVPSSMSMTEALHFAQADLERSVICWRPGTVRCEVSERMRIC